MRLVVKWGDLPTRRSPLGSPHFPLTLATPHWSRHSPLVSPLVSPLTPALRTRAASRSPVLKVYFHPMPDPRPTAPAPRPSTLPRTILFSLVLLFVGLAGFALEAGERKSKESASDLLEARLQATRHSIVLWSDDELLSAETWASAPGLARMTKALSAAAERGRAGSAALRARPEALELERLLGAEVKADHLSGYALF